MSQQDIVFNPKPWNFNSAAAPALNPEEESIQEEPKSIFSPRTQMKSSIDDMFTAGSSSRSTRAPFKPSFYNVVKKQNRDQNLFAINT